MLTQFTRWHACLLAAAVILTAMTGCRKEEAAEKETVKADTAKKAESEAKPVVPEAKPAEPEAKPAELDPALRLALARFVEMQRLSSRVDKLSESLRTRKTLEQAKSAIQAAYGYSEPEAFRWLQKTAMDQRTSMLAIAERVLDTQKSVDQGD